MVRNAFAKARLLRRLEGKGVFYKYQSAYRKDHSCEMALNEMISKVRHELHNKRETVVVFLDLKKAFDTIDRTILLRKLRKLGIRGHAHDWFESYLTERKQTVKANGQISALEGVDVGIPQGSGLGPLLFSIYVNDIYKACDLPATLLFADDTALVFTGDISDAAINASLDRVFQWFCVNKLTLNCNKTKFMVFSNKRECNQVKPKLRIYGEDIEQVSEIRYLGLLINGKLNFAGHTSAVEKKLGQLQSIFYQNKAFVTPIIGQKLITAIALPRLMFASTCFHRAPTFVLARLDVIYKRMIKTVFRKSLETPTTNVYKNTKLLPLCLLRQIQVASFAMKCLYGKCAEYLKNTIETSEEAGLRRRPRRAVAAPVETYFEGDHDDASYKKWCPKILNRLPQNMIEAAGATENGMKNFSRHYKAYLENLFAERIWSKELEQSRVIFV